MTLEAVLTGWTKPTKKLEVHIPKYSTTGDILAFKRCKRQYGYFSVRGFANATATQRYFGTLVHDVLDRVHRNYQVTQTLPSEVEVEVLVEEAHDRLYRSGIRAYNPKQQQERAVKLIYRFVVLVGDNFFPYIQQAEYRLERALQTPSGKDYILDGIVDILSGAVSHALGLPFSTEPDDQEIWDYKSGRMPEKGSPEMKDYEYQMRVYAELYSQQNGYYPARCVLAFLGELGDDKRWDEKKPSLLSYPKLIYTINPNPKHIDVAIKDFHDTVEKIEAEKAKQYQQQWHVPDHEVDDATCEACDLRYNCSGFKQSAKQRAEAL